MGIKLVYMTAESKQEAEAVGKSLVEEKLAACVNIIDRMESMFWWEGEVQKDNEVVLIAKTKDSLVPELVNKVKSIHSYSVPCVLALPVSDGNQAFLDWIVEETK